MKHLFYRLAVGVAVMCFPLASNACDICGCSGGGMSAGLLPLLQRHMFGLRWQLQGFETLPHSDGIGSTETFHTFDIWGRWQPTRRLQFSVTLPYAWSERKYSDNTQLKTRGIGDASFLLQYALLNPQKQRMRPWKHSLQFGGGLKLPTGANNLTDSEGVRLGENLQPGTGSLDFLLSGFYAVQHGKWGLSLDATARLTTANKNDYWSGNRVNAGLRAFWKGRAGKITLIPQAGAMLDSRGKDISDNLLQSDTGGQGVFSLLGIDMYLKNAALGVNWQHPVAYSYSGGNVIPQSRLNVSLTFLLGQKKPAMKPVPGVFEDVKSSSKKSDN